ncbi:FAD-binding protein [Lactiplantibacillus pentosus]|uniref:FAD-dependent oxidoreductase n=1 Tax=Lactiplantibacillus TaxID=2767842 RepID=UPI001C1ECA2A|nr:FAD-binding protein [Lactiplantibacillus sp. 30.2.29]MBU7488352.1 FAD-binding protein [Lactiplantibacillus pentosus]MBU7501483.1 FAD-binding protein [Lactiplantibacillus pentosus]MBU7507942.1 FAD-binding protein [Lactiplantibacillus pentosus]MBU7511210.1 FAD-binding protein [Lactiplantibacillus pentosus]
MKLLAIVGQNASVSYNRKLLLYMKRHFQKRTDIQIQEIGDLPMFNEDQLKHFPPKVKALIDRVGDADGVIIATPEYDHSMTASLKSVLEWLSASYHTLADKPVMIVGASFGAQGTVRAQMDLRHVLDAPGVDADVLPGHEFMLPNCQTAFDQAGNLKDAKTVKFLEECFAAFQDYVGKLAKPKEAEAMTKVQLLHYDATYDVVVLGFGGAGATAARFAADAGAKVLLVDSAPEGHEGGNTRYAGQLVGAGEDFDQLKAYYKAMSAPMQLDEDMIDTYVEGMVNMRDYMQKYLGVKPFSVAHDMGKDTPGLDLDAMVHEFPEYPGASSYDMLLVHNGFLDAQLWKALRAEVLKRADKITVWYSSPAKHLLQQPDGTVVGAQIEHDHVLVNIRATRGVVMAVGGFENDPAMIQHFLGQSKLAPVGSMYNKGDGIRMGEEAGAQMWHMANYESLGILHGLTVRPAPGERGRLLLGWPHVSEGSVFVAGDDGSRYFNEAEANRHGHLFYHGDWKVPVANDHPYLIFDQTQFAEFEAAKLPIDNFNDLTIKAQTLGDLAKLIKADPATLVKTRENFDRFIELGEDYAYGRDVDTMRAFDDGPYYALPLQQVMLNTQGGPRRNTRAEVLDAFDKPIPQLYSAGELGGINVNNYQGGNNLAECLIWGKIAGENAARPKGTTTVATEEKVTTDADTGASAHSDADTGASEHASSATSYSAPAQDFPTGEHQYIGRSDNGMGDGIVVRVTYADDTLQNVEVLQQSESGDVGLKAIHQLPAEMIAKNSPDVDAVSGASVTSNALKEAVEDAISKAK